MLPNKQLQQTPTAIRFLLSCRWCPPQADHLSSSQAFGNRILRSTACFNVCPFRISHPEHLPLFPLAFQHGVVWKALIPVAPEFIVCDGNGPSRSPWAVLKHCYGMEIIRDRKVHPNEKGSLHVKEGRLKKALFAGA